MKIKGGVLAHKKHKRKFLNIILIPDDESSPKNFKIRFSILSAALLLLVFLFVGLIIASITYGKLLQQAYENISLKQENEQLNQELQKVNDLSSELENLKTYGQKVRSTLAGYVNIHGETEALSDVPDRAGVVNRPPVSMFSTIPIQAPVTGFISQEFKQKLHNGVDIVAPEGTPILSAASGTVLYAGWTMDGGNTIVIGHESGYYTYYKHNLRNVVTENQQVNQREIIGYLGNSGQKSFGPHLHFEIWKDGIPIDPRTLIMDFNK
jgi:murein DD-endopeptidase MepM/ murein hydrolase activator NlpD